MGPNCSIVKGFINHERKQKVARVVSFCKKIWQQREVILKQRQALSMPYKSVPMELVYGNFKKIYIWGCCNDHAANFFLYYKFVYKIFTSWIIYRHVLFVLLIENINDWHCLIRCLMVCAKRRMQVTLTSHPV